MSYVKADLRSLYTVCKMTLTNFDIKLSDYFGIKSIYLTCLLENNYRQHKHCSR